MLVGFCLVCVFSPFTAGRYHSLVIEKESFPGNELEITAWIEDGLVMAACHKKYLFVLFTYYLLRETAFLFRGIDEGERSIGLGKWTLQC